MREDAKKELYDIFIAIESIDQHLGGKRDYYVFNENKTIRRAVERELEIIGEAINRIAKSAPEIIINYSRLIIDLRNRIIHGYDSVNYENIWKIIVKDLPVLKEEVENLLRQ